MSSSSSSQPSETISQPGQTNTRDPRRATALSWGTDEFTEPRTVAWDVVIPNEQISAFVQGWIPHDMDEKWFIYCEDIMENQGKETETGGGKISGLRSFFHRSWTGQKVAEIEMEFSKELDENGLATAQAKSITFEAEEEEEEIKSLIMEVCEWVLEVTLLSRDDEGTIQEN